MIDKTIIPRQCRLDRLLIAIRGLQILPIAIGLFEQVALHPELIKLNIIALFIECGSLKLLAWIGVTMQYHCNLLAAKKKKAHKASGTFPCQATQSENYTSLHVAVEKCDVNQAMA